MILVRNTSLVPRTTPNHPLVHLYNTLYSKLQPPNYRYALTHHLCSVRTPYTVHDMLGTARYRDETDIKQERQGYMILHNIVRFTHSEGSIVNGVEADYYSIVSQAILPDH